MERSEFLSKMGVGLVAVCAGCSLISCGGGSKNSDPTPAPGPQPPPGGGGALLTADLNTELLNIGDAKLKAGVIVVRLAAGTVPASFTAVQSACTHQGATIGYNNGQGIFICPSHGSEFSKTGQVVQGPAALPLHVYTVTITNNTLTVS